MVSMNDKYCVSENYEINVNGVHIHNTFIAMLVKQTFINIVFSVGDVASIEINA